MVVLSLVLLYHVLVVCINGAPVTKVGPLTITLIKVMLVPGSWRKMLLVQWRWRRLRNPPHQNPFFHLVQLAGVVRDGQGPP